MDFNPGDLVKLKSGGPLMTVETVGKQALTEEDGVWCTWFEKQALKREVFSPALLEKSAKAGLGSITLKRG